MQFTLINLLHQNISQSIRTFSYPFSNLCHMSRLLKKKKKERKKIIFFNSGYYGICIRKEADLFSQPPKVWKMSFIKKCFCPYLRNLRRKWQHTSVFLPGESQGWGSLVGCRLWGRTESDTTEATQQQQQQQQQQRDKNKEICGKSFDFAFAITFSYSLVAV